MFEKYLEKLLKETIGEFVEEIDSKELSVGLWSGKVDIKSLKLKKNLFRNYKLPIIIKYSSIKGLSLKIPWKNLFNSPLEVTIESIFILCEFAHDPLSREEREASMIQAINATIRRLGQELVEKGKEKSEEREKAGLLENFTMRMLDNLYLSVKNIHLRFEERGHYNPNKISYSFGISLESLDLCAVDSQNKKVFVDRAKLDMSATTLRKRVEMKNLAVYCNFMQTEFIFSGGSSTEGQIKQKMAKLILKSTRPEQQLSNNYILIMNVSGAIEEQHSLNLVMHMLNFQFQKLAIKIDKDILTTFLYYFHTINSLTKQQDSFTNDTTLNQEDAFLLRKYCNAFLSDFKIKDSWTPKDKTYLSEVIAKVDSEVLLQKVKYVVVHQISLLDLSKFLQIGAEDLNKGLLEVSRQLEKAPKPNTKLSLNIPQITLYIVNQFSEVLLQLNLLSLFFQYEEQLVDGIKMKKIEAQIVSLSVGNNGVFIVSGSQASREDKFCRCTLELAPDRMSVKCRLYQLALLYVPETLSKIVTMFQLQELNKEYKSAAIERFEQLEQKVNKKVSKVSQTIQVDIELERGKVEVKHRESWTMEMGKVKVNTVGGVQGLDVSAKEVQLKLQMERRQIVVVQPFRLEGKVRLANQPEAEIEIDSLFLAIDSNIIKAGRSLGAYLRFETKQAVVSRAKKNGQAFVRTSKWNKCYLSLQENWLFAWDYDREDPLLQVQIKSVNRSKRGSREVLEVRSSAELYCFTFREENAIQEWESALSQASQTKKQISTEIQSDIKVTMKVGEVSISIGHSSTIQQQLVTHIFEGKLNSIFVGYRCESGKSYISSSVKAIAFLHNSKSLLRQIQTQNPLMKFECQIDKTDIKSQFSLSLFQVDYKPSTIILLLSFFGTIKGPPSNYGEPLSVRAHQENSSQLTIGIELQSFQLTFYNKLTDMPVIMASISHLSSNVQSNSEDTSIRGQLSHFQLKDLTGYPNTRYQRQADVLPPQTIIVETNQDENRAQFKIILGVGSDKAEVKVENVKLYYIHEVVLRIVDYINSQLLEVFYYFELFPQCKGQQERGRTQIIRKDIFEQDWTQSFKNQIISQVTDKNIINTIIYQSPPMPFNILIENSSLFVLNSYESHEGLLLQSKSIVITNKQEIRSLNGSLNVPFDIYMITFRSVTLSSVDSFDKTTFIFPLNKIEPEVEVRVDYFGKSIEMSHLLPDILPLQNKVKVDVAVTPLRLELDRGILNSVLKMIDLNIFHEDGLEFLMYYECIKNGPHLNFEVLVHSSELEVQLKLNQEASLVRALSRSFAYQLGKEKHKKQKALTFGSLAIDFRKTMESRFQEVLSCSKEGMKKLQDGHCCAVEYITRTNCSNFDQHQQVNLSQLTLTFIPTCFLHFYKFILSFPLIQPLPKIFTVTEQAKSPLKMFNKGHHSLQFKLKDFLLIFVQSKTSVSLQRALIRMEEDLLMVQLSDLQYFLMVEGQTQTDLRKRTLLLPTSLQIHMNLDEIDMKIAKLFFKLSLEDFSIIFSDISQIVSTYHQSQTIKRESSSHNKQSHSLSKDNDNFNDQAQRFQKRGTQESFSKMSEHRTDSRAQVRTIDKKLIEILEEEGISTVRKTLVVSQIEGMDRQSKVKIEGVEVMVIDHLSKNLTPLLYINLKIQLTMITAATIELYAEYFNLRNYYWQPVIEKAMIAASWSQKLYMTTMQGQKQPININISTNLIENLLKAASHQQIHSSRVMYHQELNNDQINSWIVINQLGEDLRCLLSEEEAEQHEAVLIKSGQTQTVGFLSKDREFKEKEDEEEKSLRLVIGNSFTIRRLKINELGHKRLKLEVEHSSAIIIKSLTVDLSKNIKILTLSSEILFENKTDRTIIFKNKRNEELLEILPNTTKPAPYNCDLNQIYYSPQNTEEYTQNLHNLERRSKIRVNGCQFRLTYCSMKLKKYFTFYPSHKIYNYLPHSVLLHFKIKETDCLFSSLQLGSFNSEHNFGLLYHSLQDMEAAICIEGYHCCDFISWGLPFTIKDYRGNKHTIRWQTYKDNTPVIFVALIANFIISNNTEQELDILSDQRWASIKPNQNIIAQRNKLTLRRGDHKSEEFYLPKHSYEVSLRSPSKLFHSENRFIVFRNKKEVQGRVTLNVFELLPMFVFHNQHIQTVVIKQNSSSMGQIQKIEGQSSASVEWFLLHGKRRPPIFRLSLEDTFFQWSCPLNFTIESEFTFTLRNKFNYKQVKYCSIKIYRLKQTFQIVFREVGQNQIPFLIRNQMKEYRLVVVNARTEIEPEEESPFCWDDPNSSNIGFKLVPLNGNLSKEYQYSINVDKKEQESLLKATDNKLDCEIIREVNRQIFIFKDAQIQDNQAALTFALELAFSVRVALINNSISPALHLFDLSSEVQFIYSSFSNNSVDSLLKLTSIQLDNQTKPQTYFPVVLSTDLCLDISKNKYMEVEVGVKPIKLCIEEDFINDLLVFGEEIKKVAKKREELLQGASDKHSQNSQTFFISKIKLPRIVVELEIRTHKFSIQTNINLQKPDIVSYPWKDFPYPIKTIALNILSHLSISPWAFISSLGRGLEKLITEQETSRGVEGLFQQIISGATNSLSGMLGMIVGNDIQKVENFIDGVNKGVEVFCKSIMEIAPSFEGDYSAVNIVKEVGMGVIKVVVKPVAGLLRMTLKISEGIRKTSKFEFISDKVIKKRLPIVFYRCSQTFKTYDASVSELMNSLKKVLTLQTRYFYLTDLIPIDFKLTNQKHCLAVGSEELVLFDVKRERLIWKVDFDRIKKIEIFNLCTIRILLADRDAIGGSVKELDFTSQEPVKQVMELMERMRMTSSIEL